jgi:hypothetical protein
MAGSLEGEWWTLPDQAYARRQFLALLPQRRKRKERAPSAVDATVEKKPPPAVLTRPRFRASRRTVEARKEERKQAASDSSLSSGDSDPDYLGQSSDDDEEKEPKRWEALTPLADWYRDVDDGLQRTIRDVKLERYQDPDHCMSVWRGEMERWLRVLALPGVDVEKMAQRCLELWIQVHSAPAWKLRSDNTVYSVPYHVLAVLSEMRCPGGLQIRIDELRHYGTRHRYEDPPLDTVIAVPHDPAVQLFMPLKKDLARRFCEVKAQDTRQRLSSSSAASSASAPQRKTSFRWDNKKFSRCQTTLRTCLDDYHRVSYHFPT